MDHIYLFKDKVSCQNIMVYKRMDQSNVVLVRVEGPKLHFGVEKSSVVDPE
jgi:hypothetical protein